MRCEMSSDINKNKYDKDEDLSALYNFFCIRNRKNIGKNFANEKRDFTKMIY